LKPEIKKKQKKQHPSVHVQTLPNVSRPSIFPLCSTKENKKELDFRPKMGVVYQVEKACMSLSTHFESKFKSDNRRM
jgi:hypothetical protein